MKEDIVIQLAVNHLFIHFTRARNSWLQAGCDVAVAKGDSDAWLPGRYGINQGVQFALGDEGVADTCCQSPIL